MDAFEQTFHIKKTSVYFEYVKRAHELYKTRITEEESYKEIDNLKIVSDQIRECVNNSFEGDDHDVADNVIL